jgi:hypothetical protein
MDLQKQIEAKAALDFLRDHPALHNESGDSLCDGMWFMMETCCKHNTGHWTEYDGVTVWRGDPDWEKYKDLFDAQEADDVSDETPLNLRSIKVPYLQYYGEPWVADHMEYWYESSFSVFTGNPYEKHAAYDPRNWAGHGGPQGGANTFEDMLIDMAKEVKAAYGNWSEYGAFHTPEENKNHEKVEALSFVDTETPKYKQVIFNDEHVDISDGLINLRWLKWYMTTDHAKEHWLSSFPEWQTYVDKIDNMMPEEREAILSRYRV